MWTEYEVWNEHKCEMNMKYKMNINCEMIQKNMKFEMNIWNVKSILDVLWIAGHYIT